MVKEQMSMKELKAEIALARKEAKSRQQRAQLEQELKDLRSAGSNKLVKRLGRGFIILTKKGAKATGKGIVAARKFAEESGAGEGLNVRLNGSNRRISKPKRRRTTRKSRVNNDFFGGLDFGI